MASKPPHHPETQDEPLLFTDDDGEEDIPIANFRPVG